MNNHAFLSYSAEVLTLFSMKAKDMFCLSLKH